MSESNNLLCGPLLRCVFNASISLILQLSRYRRYTFIDHGKDVWHGTLLVVLKGGEDTQPELELQGAEDSHPKPIALLSEKGRTFWRWPLAARLDDSEREVRYAVRGAGLEHAVEASFWVPGKEDSMRIMFYSCNGFDTDANPDDFAGVALWKDVLRSTSRPT